MDTDILIALVTTILTSGVVSGFVTYKLNAGREERLYRRQRLEELHEAFFEVSSGLSAYWVPYIFAMANQVTYNQALDMTAGSDRQRPLPVARMEMLAALYHPALLPRVHRLLEIRKDANHIIHVHKERYRSDGPHDAGTDLRRMKELSDSLADLEREVTNALPRLLE